MDGSYRRKYREGQSHQRGGLLHTAGGVPRRPRGLTNPSQLPHVQDVLLSLRTSVHRTRFVLWKLKWSWAEGEGGGGGGHMCLHLIDVVSWVCLEFLEVVIMKWLPCRSKLNIYCKIQYT